MGIPLAQSTTNFGVMNSHDPIFFAPPPTEIPDYVWSPRHDRPCYLHGKPVRKPEDAAQIIPHPDAESALQAAKQSCRKHPDRWFGRGTGIKEGVEFWVHEGSKVLERHIIS